MKGRRELCALPPDSADAGAASAELLPAERDRGLVVLYADPDSAATERVWLGFNHDAVVGKGLCLLGAARSRVVLDRGFMVTDQINGISQSGATVSVKIQAFED
jgi:hypothetical protein